MENPEKPALIFAFIRNYAFHPFQVQPPCRIFSPEVGSPTYGFIYYAIGDFSSICPNGVINVHVYTQKKTLIDLLQSQDAVSKDDREKAFIILTYRFNEAVLQGCEIICHKKGHNASTTETIAFRTFDASARKSAFDESKGNDRDYDESVLLYLLKIAERERINYYREIERKKKNPYCGHDQIYSELPGLSLDDLDPELQLELNVINQLSLLPCSVTGIRYLNPFKLKNHLK